MKKIALIVVSLFLTLSLSAQNQADMYLNELLVTNTADFQDDFGQQNAWFELFNSSYGTVDIGGCFLSNDRNNLKKYIIPKGDVLTKIKPRQHILFWADNQHFRGTFHVNFTLAESDSIFFTASDGRTVIDCINIPKDLGENVSFGRKDDGIGSKDGKGTGWQVMTHTSPSTNNSGVDGKTKSQIMAETDPYGGIMALIAMSTVFLALIILCFLFKGVAKISMSSQDRKSKAAARKKANSEASKVVSVTEASAESFAAIAVALHLFNEENESHDDESFTITQVHTDRTYSPWSSKIYSLRQIPQVNKK